MEGPDQDSEDMVELERQKRRMSPSLFAVFSKLGPRVAALMNKQKPAKEDGFESQEELQYKLYSAREVASEMDVPPRFISAIRKFGAPFLLGQSHPAWVFNWVKEHAGDKAFQGPLQPRNRKS